MRSKLAIPAWLLGVNLAAVLCLGTGLLGLEAPELLPFGPVSKRTAWICIAVGGVLLALFWIGFVRDLKARHSGR
jgi:hypothetical protein